MGADKAVLIHTEEDVEYGDQFTTSKILAEYLKDKEVDLILSGNVAIDGGSGQVGPRVAELLGIPYLQRLQSLKLMERMLLLRDVEGDSEMIEEAFRC